MKDEGWWLGASKGILEVAVDHLERFVIRRMVYYG